MSAGTFRILSVVVLLALLPCLRSTASRHLIVGSLHEPPFVYLSGNASNPSIVDGFLYKILSLLSEHRRFNYTVKVPINGSYGVLVNETWTGGLMGQLLNKEIDIAIAPMLPSYKRYQVADYSFFSFEDRSGIMIPFPTRQKKYQAMLEPFKNMLYSCQLLSKIWIFLLASLLAVPFTLTLLEEDEQKKKRSRWIAFCDNLVTILLITTSQGIGALILTRRLATRLVLVCWCLAMCVVTYTYNGSLLSHLLKPKTAALIESIEDLAQSNVLTPVVQQGTQHLNNLLNSKTGPLQILGDYLRDNPESIIAHKKACSSLVATGKHACISEVSVLEYLVKEDWLDTRQCRVIVAAKTFATSKTAFLLPKNSAYTKDFSEDIVRLHEAGFINYWIQLYWSKPSKCNAARSSEKAKLQFADLIGAFVLLGAGAVAALMALAGELILYKFA